MSITGAGEAVQSLFSFGETVVKRIWKDPEKQAEGMLKLEELRQSGDLKRMELHVNLLLQQLELNKIDAKSSSLLQRGWRPAIGWLGAIAMALAYIPQALLSATMWAVQCYLILSAPDLDISKVQLPVYPALGLNEILGLVASMLGIGGMRSYDKKQGTDTRTAGGAK